MILKESNLIVTGFDPTPSPPSVEISAKNRLFMYNEQIETNWVWEDTHKKEVVF